MNRIGFSLKGGLLVASLAAAVAVSTVGALAHDGMSGGGTGGGSTGGGSTGGGGGSTASSLSDQINPQARTLFNQGVTYAKQKKWFLAIAAYTQAVRIEPKFAAAWNNLGHSCRKAQQYGMALDAYTQAISLAPDNPNPHEYMARTYLAMGNTEGGMREYESVRRFDPLMAGGLLKAIQANTPDLRDE
jgi:tetratricopeptide (TPR) repeat protein